ncbi:MAG: Crp/Fnr family transcriptional regulator [Micrococcales bacterium]|nr:Crp/Fnr family transcriptional regulator [Micrococcales bacterium]
MGHRPGTSCVEIVPLFAGLSPQQQDEVGGFAHPIRRSRGELIHRPGEDVSDLLVVHRGRVAISHLAANGQDRLIRVLEAGEFAGESAFVTGSRPEHTATALTDVELCGFDHRDLRALVAQYPDIAVRMLHAVVSRLEETDKMVAEQSTADVEARLVGYLLDLPSHQVDGRITVRLPLARKDIASLLGTTPETLSRRLTGLARAGLLSVHGRDVVITDPTGLAARV